MPSNSRTLYTELEWDWARRVSAGLSKLSDVLKTYPVEGHESYTAVAPGHYYVLDQKPMVPEKASETLLAVRFPDSVDLDAYETELGCDEPMTSFYIPKHALVLGQPEFVPYGVLVALAKAELFYPQGPGAAPLFDAISCTPKHERPGQFGHYHLVAFEAEYEDEEEEGEQ